MSFLGRLFGRKPKQVVDDAVVVPPQYHGDWRLAQEGEQHFLRSGDRAALEAAAAAWVRILRDAGFPATDQRFQLVVMNSAGTVFSRRYGVSGHPADLDQALRLWQEAVRATPADSPNLPSRLNNLGSGFSARYAATGEMADLAEAIRAWEQAVQATPADSPDLPVLLNNLGTGLRKRYAATGAEEDLEVAIRVYEQAVQATPVGSPNLPMLLNNLGNGLSDRYERAGELADLAEAIRVAEQAVEATPADSPALASRLNNLGSGLSDRYAATGELADLAEAIRLYEQALQATPADSPDLPAILNNLGAGLRARYAASGELADLVEAIRAWEQAVQATPADSPARPMLLNNLGIGLSDRYERTRELADLEEAIRVYEQAVEATPADSPILPGCLNNLGAGYGARYAATGAQEDLEEAIGVYEQAVQATPVGSPDLPMVHNNLGNALRDRYAATGERADLAKAIGVYEQAVQATPADTPALPGYLNNLGNGLKDRYVATGALADLAEAAGYWERASQRGLEVAVEDGLRAARNWMNTAFERRAWQDVARAYGYAGQAMDTLFQTQWDRAAKEAWLREAQGLPGLAAYSLVRLEQPQEAIATLEAGRARLLAEALEQSRRDLERLPELGQAGVLERYRQATGRMQALQQRAGQRAEPGARRPSSRDLAQEMAAARAELDAAIAAIRQVEIEGQRPYADFLMPPTFAEIQQAAVPGARLVYLVTTLAGSLALLLAGDEVEALWIDDLNETHVREALLGPADRPAPGGYLGAYDRLRRDSRDESARQAWLEVLDGTTRWLWDALMGPLVELLGARDVRQATLLPAGALGLLPLHAAWTEDPNTPTGRRYALDAFAIAYAPSASTLAVSREAAGSVPGDAVLAVDNPDGSLRFSAQEVEAVLSYFPDGSQQALRGKAATREAVLQELPAYPVLHFSTHGWAGWREPLESGLLMASAPHLLVGDFLDLRLQGARLAVLSACETGIPGTELPDEVVSLPTGLVQAGVAGVVASLWPVNDLSTAMLMERFYRLWREGGLAPAEALRQAQIWLRDTTNREKAEYFQQDVPALAGLRMPADVAADLYVDRMLSQDPDGRDFAHPFWWAAFSMTGA